MTTPEQERKRPLGQPVAWQPHMQQTSAEKASAAGSCGRDGTERGRSAGAQHSASFFSYSTTIDPDLQEALSFTVHSPDWLLQYRASALLYWERRAHELLPLTDAILQAVPDTWLRALLRGARDHEPLQLGQCTHVALWEELMQHAKSVDAHLVKEMTAGMSIVEDIRRAHRWEPYDKPQELLPFAQLKNRAWEFRQKVLRNVLKCEVTDNTQKVWDATIEDVNEGLTQGPFYDQEEVSRLVGDSWIPTQRFEVVQKNKVRGVDSATTNGINKARWLETRGSDGAVKGYVLDGRKAYRQVPIHPSHRRWSVICMRDPSDGRLAFFIMVGHSFGLVSAVYNYNRRSAAITDILRRVFLVAAFNFYDDSHGFEHPYP